MPPGRKKHVRKSRTCTVSLPPEIYSMLEIIADSGHSNARTVPAVGADMIVRGLDSLKPDGLIGKLLHERIAGGREPK